MLLFSVVIISFGCNTNRNKQQTKSPEALNNGAYIKLIQKITEK